MNYLSALDEYMKKQHMFTFSMNEENPAEVKDLGHSTGMASGDKRDTHTHTHTHTQISDRFVDMFFRLPSSSL